MIRKHVQEIGVNWDKYLPGLLWAYRNVPHESTGEKPSYLLYGFDCRSPTEAALLSLTPPQPVHLDDYQQELVLSLSAARECAVTSIQKAQSRYKRAYDKGVTSHEYIVGQWVLIQFPQEESG